MYRLLRYGKDGNEVSYKIEDIVSKNLYDENGNPLYQTSQLGELPPGIMPEETTDSIDVLAYLKNDTDSPLSQNISKIINDPELREKIQYVLGVGTQAFNEDDDVVKILKNKLENFEQGTLGILALKKIYTGKDMQEFKAMLSLYKNDPNSNQNFVSLINDVAKSYKLGPEDINKKITKAVRILSYLEHDKILDINNYVVQEYLLREEGLKSPDIVGLSKIEQENYDLIKENYTASQLESKLAFKDSLAEITPEIEKILKEIIKQNPDATLSANGFGELFVTLKEGEPKIPLRDPEGFNDNYSETNIGPSTRILIDQVAAIVKSALYQGKVNNIVSCTIPLGSEQDKSINEQRNTIIKILSELAKKETYTNPAYINVIRKYFYIPEDILKAAFEGGNLTELLRNKNFIFQIQNGSNHYVSVSMKIDHENNISVQYKDSLSSSHQNKPENLKKFLIPKLVSSIKEISNTKGKASFINTPYTIQQHDGNSCGFWTAVNSLTLGDYQFIPKDEYDILSDSNIRNKIFSKLKPWSINGKIDGNLMKPFGTRNSGRTKTDDTNQGGLLSNFKLTRFIKYMYRTQNNGNDQLEAEKTKINKEAEKTRINGLNNATSKDDFIAKCKRILDHKDKVFDENGSRRFIEKIIACSEIEDKNYDLQNKNVKKIIDIYRIVSDENDKKIDRIKEVLKDIGTDTIETLLYKYDNENEKIKEINGYIEKKYFYKLFLAASSDKDLIIKIIGNTVYKENNFIKFLNDNQVIEENPNILIGYSHALCKDLSLDDFCTFLEFIPIDYRIAVIRSFKDDKQQNILLKAIEKSDDIEFIQRILPEVNTGKNEELKDILDKTTLARKTVVKAQEILTLLEKRKYDPDYIDSKQKEIKKIIPYAGRTIISAIGLSPDARDSLSSEIKSITPENEDNSSTMLEKFSTIVKYSTKAIMAIPVAAGAAITYGIKKLGDVLTISDERGEVQDGTTSEKTRLLSDEATNTMQHTQGPDAINMDSSNYLVSTHTEDRNNNSNSISISKNLIKVGTAIAAIPVAAGAAIISGIGDRIKNLKDYFPTSYSKAHISDDLDDLSEVSHHNGSEREWLLPKQKKNTFGMRLPYVSNFLQKSQDSGDNQQNQTYSRLAGENVNDEELMEPDGKKMQPTRNELLKRLGDGNFFLERDYIETILVDATRLGEQTKSILLRLKNADNETNYPSLIAAGIYGELEDKDAKSALRTLFLKNFPVDGNQADQYSNLDHFINSVENENIDQRIKQMIIGKANQRITQSYGTFDHEHDSPTISDDATQLCFGPFGSNIADWNSIRLDDDTVECFPPFLGGGRSRSYSDASDIPLTFSGGGRAATPPKQTLFPPMPPSTFLNAVIHSPADKKADRQTNFDSLLGLAKEQKTNISSDFVTNNPDQSIEDKFRKDHDFSISYVDVADNQEQKEKDIIYMAASAAVNLKLEPVIIYGGTYEEQIIAIKSALRQGFTAITVCEPKKGTKPDEYTELLNLTRMIRDNYKEHGSCLDTMNNIENQRVTVKGSVNNVLTDTEKALYNDIMSIPTPTHNHIASP